MMPVFVDEEETVIYCYYEHPKNFIPSNCHDWHLEYEYYKDFGGAPSFDECSLRFIEAKHTYEGYLRYWRNRENNEGHS